MVAVHVFLSTAVGLLIMSAASNKSIVTLLFTPYIATSVPLIPVTRFYTKINIYHTLYPKIPKAISIVHDLTTAQKLTSS